jgi:hypothetical protein
VRPETLRILLMSLAFHLSLAVVLVWWLDPGITFSAAPERAFAKMIYVLRSEPVPDRLTPPAPAHDFSHVPLNQPLNPAGPPILATTAPASAPALALKDKAHLQPRGFTDSPAPAIDPRRATVFVLDISGSMYEAYAGSTRLALARRLLAQRIESLADGTPFAIVVYGETTLRSGPLARADDASRRIALDFLARDYDCGGGTDLPAGLARAQELRPGAIVVLTDGDLNMNGRELLSKSFQVLGAKGACPALTLLAIAPRPHTDAMRLLKGLAQQQGGICQTAPEIPALVTENPAR